MRNTEVMRSIILSAAQRRGIRTVTALSEKTGINRSTLDRKLKDPWMFTVHDLFAIDRVARFTDGELEKLIRGK